MSTPSRRPHVGEAEGGPANPDTGHSSSVDESGSEAHEWFDSHQEGEFVGDNDDDDFVDEEDEEDEEDDDDDFMGMLSPEQDNRP